jgi:hypothetical protein
MTEKKSEGCCDLCREKCLPQIDGTRYICTNASCPCHQPPEQNNNDVCVNCGYNPIAAGHGWLLSNPVTCPECRTMQPPEHSREESEDEFIRDVCSVVPKSKSEVRARLSALIAKARADEREAALEILTDEIASAHAVNSGGKTSRLTSAYMRIASRTPNHEGK